MNNSMEPEEQLSKIFGSYKAEWLKEQIYDLFTEPSYMPELLTSRPCILVGGRGTGKTTALRALSYEGTRALAKQCPTDAWDYYGFYYRVNTNRVTSFEGQDKDTSFWRPIFAHYMNLIFSELLVDFLIWREKECGTSYILDSSTITKVTQSLCIEACSDVADLKQTIELSKINLEAYINNIEEEDRPKLSLQGAPLDLLFQSVGSSKEYVNTNFFILIDEFENFLDYQQQVLNTLIKHSGEAYTFKIGVRELGWRIKETLNENERLIHPADYIKIDISKKLSGETYSKFAKKICNGRLRVLHEANPMYFTDISTALCSMSVEDESIKLGVNKRLEEYYARHDTDLKENLSGDEYREFKSKHPLEQYTSFYLACGKTEIDFDDFRISFSPAKWKNRYDNYKFAMLFTITTSKFSGYKKYYSGWETILQISGGNIRYLLTLVEQTLLLHYKKTKDQLVDCDTQTKASVAVAKNILTELEGLSTHGAQLTKMLLSLGRVFGVLAAEAKGKSPEITQFEFEMDGEHSSDRVNELIKSAVMNLALLRFPGTKLSDPTSIRDYDYMIHPIFSPFFAISYRKKRKILIRPDALVNLIDNHRDGIKKLLNSKGIVEVDLTVPQQLSLFSGYYND